MLDVNCICCGYGQTDVLKDVSFSVEKGECIGIIGPNGSGKSTLLKAMSKILKPTSGSVVLLGKGLDQYSSKELARNMAVVPQDAGVEFDFSCLDIVTMGRSPHMKRFEIEGKKDMDIVRQSMELTNTWGLRDRPYSQVSGGERQRLTIARALAQQPSVLLLDEPVSHLDIEHQIEVLDLVERLKKEKGIMVVMILHDLNLAARYCDRLILLSGNSILAGGRPDEVLTEANIACAFHARVLIRKHPLTGYLYVTLLNSIEMMAPSLQKTIHVVCGAGTGTQILYSLRTKGYRVTAGVLNVLDSDYETASQLGIKTVSEAPFSPITPDSYAQNVELMKNADVIVLSGVPFGFGNLKNLEAVLDVAALKPVMVMASESERDFTGGTAGKIIDSLATLGAVQVSGVEALIAALGR
jgi:iron complex transport system ATP-binding protein